MANGVKGKRLRTIDDLPIDGKRVLVRVDFNVSVGEDGKVDATEDYRIEAALPTIEELMQRRCKVILLTHRGEPLEKPEDADLSAIHRRLQDLLKEEVKLTRSLFGDDVGAIMDGLEPGGVIMLPNVRSDIREEKGNLLFAEQLASHADVFVNEAFSVSHRAHTSVAFIPQKLPACAGRRTVIEIAALEKLRTNPDRPYVALASGAKISTKVGMLYDLLEHVDTLCVGGQLASVFLAAQGKHQAEGWFSPDDIAAAKRLLDVGSEKLVLPTDVVVGDKEGKAGVTHVKVEDIPSGLDVGAYDIGPETVQTFINFCRSAKTIMWNGPMGLFEVPAYAESTFQLARALAALPAWRVVGGGDTVNALERERLVSKFDHVSVGGGAMVAFLEGKRLPGLEPLYA